MESEKHNLPYYEIPEAPEQYTAASSCARMIDGLGFRFYWGSEGLREEDLLYKPSPEARTSSETIDHIYDLVRMINKTVKGIAIEKEEKEELSFDDKRKGILFMLKESADVLRENPDLNDLDVVFKGTNRTKEYPFWNLINGPLSDAIWHTGQIVSFRRASGNPFNSNVSVFNGTVRE